VSQGVENPLLAGLSLRRTPEPCAVVIFGASGDLTQRKLIPALYSLACNRLLPAELGVVGVARTPMSDEKFRATMRQAVQEHGREELREDVWERLAGGMHYVPTELTRVASSRSWSVSPSST
jgi:glucose-6-phosphate 1-dehydrogenase